MFPITKWQSTSRKRKGRKEPDRKRTGFGRVWTYAVALSLGCEPPRGRVDERALSEREPSYAAGVPTSLAVPGDGAAHVSHGIRGDGRVVVYLHGRCSDPVTDLRSWGGLATRFGTMIALVGDVACDNGTKEWSLDESLLEERIEGALAELERVRSERVLKSDAILVGESQGASRVERLAARYPERYRRLVLIGAPSAPSFERLRNAVAVATLAGSREPQEDMTRGARALESAGLASRFFELPGAAHGEYGPEGQRVMTEALTFVSAPSSDATSR